MNVPYIEKSRRAHIDGGQRPKVSGDLNYAITKLINNYIKDHGQSYMILNDVVGALECAKLELYRRVIGPYEDQKIEENGDVYAL